jgi:hypothetical protein
MEVSPKWMNDQERSSFVAPSSEHYNARVSKSVSPCRNTRAHTSEKWNPIDNSTFQRSVQNARNKQKGRRFRRPFCREPCETGA